MTDPSHLENVNLRSMNSFLEDREACNTFWKNPSKQLKQQAWMLKTVGFGKQSHNFIEQSSLLQVIPTLNFLRPENNVNF